MNEYVFYSVQNIDLKGENAFSPYSTVSKA